MGVGFPATGVMNRQQAVEASINRLRQYIPDKNPVALKFYEALEEVALNQNGGIVDDALEAAEKFCDEIRQSSSLVRDEDMLKLQAGLNLLLQQIVIPDNVPAFPHVLDQAFRDIVPFAKGMDGILHTRTFGRGGAV